MYQVIFDDEVHGETTQNFETFQEAFDYWQDYAETPTCIHGQLWDMENGEVFWEF